MVPSDSITRHRLEVLTQGQHQSPTHHLGTLPQRRCTRCQCRQALAVSTDVLHNQESLTLQAAPPTAPHRLLPDLPQPTAPGKTPQNAYCLSRNNRMGDSGHTSHSSVPKMREEDCYKIRPGRSHTHRSLSRLCRVVPILERPRVIP